MTHARGGTGAGVLVGRAKELGLVDAVLDELTAGRPTGLAVSGEPGIGKTRLTEELATRARARGFLVLRGAGSELEQDVPYAVIIAALDPELARTHLSLVSRLGADRVAALGQIFPALARRAVGATPLTELDPHRFHGAIMALLTELADSRPVVLVLDDLQWADESSLDLLAFVLRHRRYGSLLPVLAYRPAQAPPILLRAIGRGLVEARLRDVGLKPLADADVAPMLEGVKPAMRAEILRLSGGNPFYVDALAAAARGGSLPDGPGLGRDPDVAPGVIVPAVRAAIVVELAAVTLEARSFAKAAAVAGDPFELDLAADIAGLDLRASIAAVDELFAHDIVRATDVPRQFAFRHPIVRRVVYDWAGEPWRLEGHGRAAAVLADSGVPAAGRAHHVECSAAPGDAEAVRTLLEAGADAATQAPAAAARWYGAALRLLGDGAAPEQRLPVLTARAVALVSTGRSAAARETLVEALALAPAELSGQRAELVARLARAENMLGRYRSARELVSNELDSAADDESASALGIELAVTHWYSVDWRAMEAAAAAASAHVARLNAPAMQTEAQALLAVAQQGMLRGAQARATIDEAERLAAQTPDDAMASRLDVLDFLGYATHDFERYRSMYRHHSRLLRIARETGQRFYFAPALAGLTIACVRLGRLGEAERTAEEGLDEVAGLDDQARMRVLFPACLAATARGDLTAAVRVAEQGTRALRRTPSVLFDGLLSCSEGWVRIELGDIERGVAAMTAHGSDRELARSEPWWRPTWAALVAETLAHSEPDAAREWADRAHRWAEAVDLDGCRGDADRAQARVLLAAGDAAGGLQAAERAVERYAKVGRAVDAARAEVVSGLALAGLGDRPAALRRLQQAHDVLSATGAARSRDAAAQALRELGGRVARSAPPVSGAKGIAALTARERELAMLVGRGLKNREIAAQLFLSEKTVENHLSRIFDKLQVRRRSALAALFERDAGPEPGDPAR